jgi:hypothetical protein
MAREEQDREDLMREATALVERIELRLPQETEPVVVGFRRAGGASFFFGDDPVYQFNAAGELRRAYVGGKLLKAERRRLVELTRVRTPAETQLVRHEFDDAETAPLLEAMQQRLARLRDALDSTFDVVAQVPADVDVVGRIRRELAALCRTATIADSPHAGK